VMLFMEKVLIVMMHLGNNLSTTSLFFEKLGFRSLKINIFQRIKYQKDYHFQICLKIESLGDIPTNIKYIRSIMKNVSKLLDNV